MTTPPQDPAAYTPLPAPLRGRPILVASHERSGTHLTMDLLRKQFAQCRPRVRPGQSLHKLYLSLERFHADAFNPVTTQEARWIAARARRICLKTHDEPGTPRIAPQHQPFVRALLQHADTIYCVRDGRDVLTSFHTWAQFFDPATRVPFPDFIRQRVRGLSRPAQWARHVELWLDTPNALIFKFESIILNPREALNTLAQHLGMTPLYREPLLPQPIMNKWQSWRARALGRAESTNVHGRSRGLKPLKWHEAFSKEDHDFFIQEAGHIMARLGYNTAADRLEGRLISDIKSRVGAGAERPPGR